MSFLVTAPLVSAAKNEAQAQAPDSAKYRQLDQAPMPATDDAVQNQNQNQVQTQNAGEDSQLQVNTQELEQEMKDYYDREVPDSTAEAGMGGAAKQNSKAQEQMSSVAQKVQQLLEVKEDKMGIGQQVKQFAQEQQQVQMQLQDQLNKVESRQGLMKSLLGPDYKALKSLSQEMEQNQLRIHQLEEMQTQLLNEADSTMVQEAIQALVEQNTALEEMLNAEESTPSLLGWLFKMLAK